MMVLRRFLRFLGISSRNRTKAFLRWFLLTFLLVVVIFHIQLQVTGNIHLWRHRGLGPNPRRRDVLRKEDGETFAWYGGQRGRAGDGEELFYIDITNTDDEKPIPPPANLGGPRRLILGKKNLLSSDDSFKKTGTEAGEVVPENLVEDVSNIGLRLQPWASSDHSLDSEASRFLKYINTEQTTCDSLTHVGCSEVGCGKDRPFSLCFQEMKKQRHQCIVYSFRSSFSRLAFENELANEGCEVHVFDPTQRAMRYEPNAGNPKGGVERNLVFHRITLDWRETTSDLDMFGPPTLRAKNLKTIMSELGHDEVQVLVVDLESSEWKIIESLIISGWITHINQFIFNVHLHWSGFEVSGSKPTVVRFWYTALSRLENFGFRLFSSVANTKSIRMFLGEREKFNASSTYTLGWIRNL